MFTGKATLLISIKWLEINKVNTWIEYEMKDYINNYTFLIFSCDDANMYQLWSESANSRMIPSSMFIHNDIAIGIPDIFFDGVIGIKIGFTYNKILIVKKTINDLVNADGQNTIDIYGL